MEQKIVVHTQLGPQGACPEEMEALSAPDIAFFRRGPCRTPQAVLAAIHDADVALCMQEPYPREVLAQSPRLKAVVRYGVGVDTIDVDAATELGIVVANFPDFCTREVANHAIGFVIACAKKYITFDRVLRAQGWDASRTWRTPMGPLHGETLGLVAFGHIARAVAQRAQAFEMKVIAYDPFVDAATMAAVGVEKVSLEELAARADYLSCHAPLNAHTEGMINAAFFARMKPTAYFINTSRGPVVNEPDLIAALRERRIAGAALDVFEQEPFARDHPFLSMDNILMTPHTASYADVTFAVRNRRVGVAAVTLARGGVPEIVANPQVLPHRRR